MEETKSEWLKTSCVDLQTTYYLVESLQRNGYETDIKRRHYTDYNVRFRKQQLNESQVIDRPPGWTGT